MLKIKKQRKKQSIEPRFWSQVEKTETCWNWKGCLSNRYGSICWNSKNIRTHRLSYILHYGEIPNDKHVLHSCDNPICVNPEHLWLGTHADNMLDKIKKNRHLFKGIRKPAKVKIYLPRKILLGEEKPNSKLTGVQVKAIRAMYKLGFTKAGIARKFNGSETTIRAIVNGRIWRHIND